MLAYAVQRICPPRPSNPAAPTIGEAVHPAGATPAGEAPAGPAAAPLIADGLPAGTVATMAGHAIAVWGLALGPLPGGSRRGRSHARSASAALPSGVTVTDDLLRSLCILGTTGGRTGADGAAALLAQRCCDALRLVCAQTADAVVLSAICRRLAGGLLSGAARHANVPGLLALLACFDAAAAAQRTTSSPALAAQLQQFVLQGLTNQAPGMVQGNLKAATQAPFAGHGAMAHAALAQAPTDAARSAVAAVARDLQPANAGSETMSGHLLLTALLAHCGSLPLRSAAAAAPPIHAAIAAVCRQLSSLLDRCRSAAAAAAGAGDGAGASGSGCEGTGAPCRAVAGCEAAQLLLRHARALMAASASLDGELRAQGVAPAACTVDADLRDALEQLILAIGPFLEGQGDTGSAAEAERDAADAGQWLHDSWLNAEAHEAAVALSEARGLAAQTLRRLFGQVLQVDICVWHAARSYL